MAKSPTKNVQLSIGESYQISHVILTLKNSYCPENLFLTFLVCDSATLFYPLIHLNYHDIFL